MATKGRRSVGRRAPRNRKGTCTNVKNKAGKRFPRASQIRGPHKRSAPGYGPFTSEGDPNPQRCAQGKYSSTGNSFSYSRTKSGMTKWKKGCTVRSGKLVDIQSSDFCISRKKDPKKARKAKARAMRPCLGKKKDGTLYVVSPTSTGKCRKGSNRGDVRKKAFAAQRRKPASAKRKGAANRRARHSKASANFVCQSRSTKKFTRRTANGQCRKGSKKIRI